MIIVLMGVSGCGKTAIGERLSSRLGWPFCDSDSLHSPEMKEKMRAGVPLNDEDRAPWLQRIADRITRAIAGGESLVVSCSALRERYRRVLRGEHQEVFFVHLTGSKELIAARLACRAHEFMNPSLLDSQFETLEEPEDALAVDIDERPDLIVEEIRTRLGLN